MITQAVLKISYWVAPEPKPGNPIARRLIVERKASGQSPRSDTSVTELRLTGGYAIILLVEQLALLLALAATAATVRRAVVGVDVFLAALLFGGIVLHLGRYYYALVIYYRERQALKRGRRDFTDRLGARSLSKDRDLIFQVIFAVVVLFIWLASDS